MKRLTLLRHAKSTWEEPVGRDFDRPITAKGRRAARAIGRHMRAEGMVFDHVVASPAVRVMETLDHMWDGYGRTLPVAFDTRVYLASGATLLDVLRETPDDVDSLLVAGHSPGTEELALLLAGDGGPAREALEEKFPTAAMAEIRFDTHRWQEVAAGSGTLIHFVRPRDLDATLGPETVT